VEPFNARVLEAVLAVRHLSLAKVSSQIGMSEADLRRQIAAKQGPSQTTIKKLSNQLSVPPLVFYMDKAPAIHQPIVDFRSADPRPSSKSRETVESVEMSYRIQEVAEDLGFVDELSK
jgi:hypothetical protein